MSTYHIPQLSAEEEGSTAVFTQDEAMNKMVSGGKLLNNVVHEH